MLSVFFGPPEIDMLNNSTGDEGVSCPRKTTVELSGVIDIDRALKSGNGSGMIVTSTASFVSVPPMMETLYSSRSAVS